MRLWRRDSDLAFRWLNGCSRGRIEKVHPRCVEVQIECLPRHRMDVCRNARDEFFGQIIEQEIDKDLVAYRLRDFDVRIDALV